LLCLNSFRLLIVMIQLVFLVGFSFGFLELSIDLGPKVLRLHSLKLLSKVFLLDSFA
jgi:hypothetical protein